MGDILVVYFSKTGNNKFLANKIADALNADLELLKPRFQSFSLLSSLLNINFGIHPISKKLRDYRLVILCGPIWMGTLIAPMKSFLKKYKSQIAKLVFTTCCGSTDEKSREKFGYALVFEKVEKIIGKKLSSSEAFPIALVLPENEKENGDLIMKTRLTEKNFKGEILNRFNNFIAQIKIRRNTSIEI